MRITVNSESASKRVDAFLAEQLNISRARVQKIIDNCLIINGKQAKSSQKVYEGDEVEFEFEEPQTVKVFKQDLPLNIIYEDDDVIVINKKRGMVVHPAAGHFDGTLVNALAYHCNIDEIFKGEEVRPGLVHRIDQDTSGLLVVAKNVAALEFLSSQLQNKTMHREYMTLVEGIVRNDLIKVIAPIARDKNYRERMAVNIASGKEATTHFKVIKRFANQTLLSCSLETGRTHQIRVHLSYINYPIIGDKQYNTKKYEDFKEGQLLHAYKLTFVHPRTKKTMTFYAPLDDYFKKALIKYSK